ncbi:hypothetical protein [Agromyces humi]|uniref:hypothetical protein n=1 Tax=Agromyces humi TaxID=1766800 RepID=UPI001356E7CB|nr:hypothetical protein [Agromyces humi]
MTDFRVDPAKIDARVAAYEALAVREDEIAEALESLADDKRRKASRLREQNAALLETARKYGYPGADEAERRRAYQAGEWCGECRFGVVENPPCCTLPETHVPEEVDRG